ncbi:MAG: Iron-sulfur flavoprotein [Deltaproteobacteria bacterium]|nr:Iron-sulfur flavoprotein [Deltaproteobacteria bacterium]
MKILAFNCSPKAEKANTSLILNPFLKGLENGGAEVELHYTRRLRIRPCSGDLHCWFQKPGVCIHQDDMQGLYPKLREADIWVFGTPLLVHMKAFCRTIGREFAGALLRPHGETFKGLLELNRPVQDIVDAAESAGRQLAQEGIMPERIPSGVSREITPLDRFMATSNKICQQHLDALEGKK